LRLLPRRLSEFPNFGHFLLLDGLLQNRLTWPGVPFLQVHDLLR
jgi:hypothetical protein